MPRSGGEPRCVLCGTSAQRVAVPGLRGHEAPRRRRVGASRTAEELGRAFPNARVIVSDGERPVLEVGAEPALVIATRGAEPIADGGYRAVLLLDGERMLAARIAARRRGLPAVVVERRGPRRTGRARVPRRRGRRTRDARSRRGASPIGRRTELADRRALRFPPAVRVASVTAAPPAVVPGARCRTRRGRRGRCPRPDRRSNDGLDRAIVRFDYARGRRRREGAPGRDDPRRHRASPARRGSPAEAAARCCGCVSTTPRCRSRAGSARMECAEPPPRLRRHAGRRRSVTRTTGRKPPRRRRRSSRVRRRRSGASGCSRRRPSRRLLTVLGVPVIEANRLDADATDAIEALEPDLGVIVAYGGLVREPLLSAPAARLDQPALLAPARVARRRTRAARPDRGRRRDRGIRVPARARARRGRRVRDALAPGRRRRDRRRPARGARADREPSCSPTSSTPSPTARPAPSRRPASRRLAPKLDDRRRPPRLGGARARGAVDRFRGVTPEPGAWTTIDDAPAEGARPRRCAVDGCRAARAGRRRARRRPAPRSAPERGPLELRRVQPAGRTAMDAADWWRGAARARRSPMSRDDARRAPWNGHRSPRRGCASRSPRPGSSPSRCSRRCAPTRRTRISCCPCASRRARLESRRCRVRDRADLRHAPHAGVLRSRHRARGGAPDRRRSIPRVLDVLRLGVHQLLATRVPTHAAVYEQVALARRVAPKAAGFANAVLRTVSRTAPEAWRGARRRGRAQRRRPHRRASRAIRRGSSGRSARRSTREDRADELEALLAADNAAPRVNLAVLPGLGVDTSGIAGFDADRFSPDRRGRRRSDRGGRGIATAASGCRTRAPSSRRSPSAAPIRFARGSGGSTSAPARAARPRCSRPRRSPAARRLVANETRPRSRRARAQRHRRRAERRSRSTSATAANSTLAALGAPGGFDRILLDAPCTGLGALRRRPEARWRKAPSDVAELTKLQGELFDAAVAAPCAPAASSRTSPARRTTAETQGTLAAALERWSGTVEQLDTRAVVRGRVEASARSRAATPRPCSSGRTGTAPTRCSSRSCARSSRRQRAPSEPAPPAR